MITKCRGEYLGIGGGGNNEEGGTLVNDKLRKLHLSQYVIRIITLKRVRWAGYVVGVGVHTNL